MYSHTARKGPLVRSVLNILEDVRIENAILGPYPGSVRTLDETLGWLVREGKTTAAKAGDSPPMVLGAFLLTTLRYRVQRQVVLKDLADESERVLREIFPASFVHRLLGLLAEVPGLDSTASTADLAERIVALVRQEAQEPPPAAESDDGAGDQEPGGADADGREALRAILSAGEGHLPEDLFEAVAEALNAQTVGTAMSLLPSLENYAGDRVLGTARLAGVKGESAKLAARLQGLVQAHDMATTRTVRRGRALSTRHLHRAAVGDDRIFQRTDQRTSPNTAIHLLLDLSSSMNGGADRIALDAAMSLALALEPIRGVSCAATAQPTPGPGRQSTTDCQAWSGRRACPVLLACSPRRA